MYSGRRIGNWAEVEMVARAGASHYLFTCRFVVALWAEVDCVAGSMRQCFSLVSPLVRLKGRHHHHYHHPTTVATVHHHPSIQRPLRQVVWLRGSPFVPACRGGLLAICRRNW